MRNEQRQRCTLRAWARDLNLAVPPGQGEGVTIALIDDGVVRRIPPLRGARILARDFVRAGGGHDTHGTLCASALIGRCDAFVGLAPQARLLSARVRGGPRGTQPLCDALDWLLDERPDVVCIPMGRSRSCGRVTVRLRRLEESGIHIVAAAGNWSPEQMLFPASSRHVTAVTAVDERGDAVGACYQGRGAVAVVGHAVPTWGLHGPTWFGRSSAAATVAVGLHAASLSSHDGRLVS